MSYSIDLSPAPSVSHRRPGMISELAVGIVTRMAQKEGSPSIAMLVDSLAEVQDRLPQTFEEQIYLLEAIGWSCDIYLTKPGTAGFVVGLERIINHLELCGEVPSWSLQI